jgi:hypothetical protein
MVRPPGLGPAGGVVRPCAGLSARLGLLQQPWPPLPYGGGSIGLLRGGGIVIAGR